MAWTYVYAVFCVTGDTDGVAVHDLVGIARTRHAASEIIQEQFDDTHAERDLVHP